MTETQRNAITTASTGSNGGSSFADDYYWSSTDYSTNNAWHQLFSDGAQNTYEKLNANLVRAVRAFLIITFILYIVILNLFGNYKYKWFNKIKYRLQ